jgi:hypothetical protein
VEVYAASGEQPPLDRRHDELTAEEKEVDLFFSDQQNVDRLVELLALEEKKGKDKFNGYRFIMFKVRFQKSLCVISVFRKLLQRAAPNRSRLVFVGWIKSWLSYWSSFTVFFSPSSEMLE